MSHHWCEADEGLDCEPTQVVRLNPEQVTSHGVGVAPRGGLSRYLPLTRGGFEELAT